MSAEAPTGLMTDLLEHTQRVYHDGYPTNLSVDQMTGAIERLQYPAIISKRPTFSWVVNDSRNNVLQTAYEIELAASPGAFATAKGGLMWRSGKVVSNKSSSVLYAGQPLKESTVYYWRVRTWNNGDLSPWSETKMFKTAAKLEDYGISRYPTVKETHYPITVKKLSPQLTFFDFEKAAFGQLRVRITAKDSGETAVVRLGERIKDGRVDTKPAGSTRYAEYKINLIPGTHTYFVKTRIDKRNTTGAAFLMPDYIGEVMPFRYVEVETHAQLASPCAMEREAVFYPFNENASFFHCDNSILNQVWDLCRYSMKATGFMGVFIDGDRERIPYEGDSVLNQLSYYSVDREYSLARFTQDYLIHHPTWPTEWVLQSVQMAWYDYLYTGDTRNIAKLYDELKAKSLLALAESNGLISTKKGKLTLEVLNSVHFTPKQKMRDIVDWPHKGLAGNDNAASGETDGFVFCDFNVVVNSYHYFALRSLRNFADILGKKEDVTFFDKRIALVQKSFQSVFFDAKQGHYRDGETTDHASLHGNMFPLAFGLVPQEHVPSVTNFVKSRGMKCSVYGAQFLLDAVYTGCEGDYGLERMTATDRRGWYNMLRLGSTISLEAWDDCYKPNQDWNHAWG
ncbi:MAG: family 78 glycoside hydrolase catalytic domain, partial [Planctomycetia bacterium]|nr:family 78 glycoside hydrolase catalytic domain [Planctomycetia bacterium]